jgi:predicted nucleotidyltransferase
MRNVIFDKLKAFEDENNKVTMLFACESGSRASGFAPPDSDYDVLFIYVHRKNYYPSIEEQRDVKVSV